MQPVFLIGYGRSGTTLLLSRLAGHPDIRFEGENNLLYNLCRDGVDLSETAAPAALAQRAREAAVLGKQVRAFVERFGDLEDLANRHGARTLADLFRIMVTEGETPAVWGDKSPLSTLIIGRIRQAYPGARFIHLVRDPRDVILSYFRKRRSSARQESQVPDRHPGPRDAPVLHIHMQRWQYWNQAVEEMRDDDILTLRYEDLVCDPDAQLTRLCAFVGVPFHEDMIHSSEMAGRLAEMSAHRRVNGPIQNDRIKQYEAALRPWMRRLAENLCGDLMDRYGYERSSGLGVSSALLNQTLAWRTRNDLDLFDIIR